MKTFSDIVHPWIATLPIYEPGRPIEEVARELGIRDVDGIIKLASNENALGPSPMALETMTQAASQMHRYPDGGTFYLKRAMAEKLSVSPDELLFGNGSNELLELLGHVFLGPGSNVVVAEYAFVVYRLVAAMFRAEVVAVPMRDLVHDLDAMAAAITGDTRIVYVSNPNNPTSTMVDGEAIDAFMARVPDDVIVCFDEAYVELLDPAQQPDTLRYVRDGRNVVVLRTFSKAYGLAGLRVGYAVAPAECVRLLNRARQPFNVNAMAQAAALAALDDEGHLSNTRRLVADGLAYLAREAEGMGLRTVPACANFMLIETGNGREVYEHLQRLGVIVRPMDGYGLGEYIRVTVGTMPENEKFVAALKTVLDAREHTG